MLSLVWALIRGFLSLFIYSVTFVTTLFSGAQIPSIDYRFFNILKVPMFFFFFQACKVSDSIKVLYDFFVLSPPLFSFSFFIFSLCLAT